MGSNPTWTTKTQNMFSKFLSLFKTKIKNNRLKPIPISELSEIERETVKSEYEAIKLKIDAANEKTRNSRYEYAKLANDKCPHCKSTNVNERIKRIQGSLKGSSSGSYSLFGGSSSGYISGSLDTNEVNKCNDCQHEWKITSSHEYHFISLYDVVERLNRTMEKIQKIINGDVKWDPNDLDEKCTSKEEKIQQELAYYLSPKNYITGDVFEFLSGSSLETINYLVESQLTPYPTINEGKIKEWRNANYQLLLDHFDIKPLRNNNL